MNEPFQLKPLPPIDPDPQILMYLWFHTVATPEQRAAAIAATMPKTEKDKDDDAEKSQ